MDFGLRQERRIWTPLVKVKEINSDHMVLASWSSSRADRVAVGLTAVVSSARWWSFVLLARMESAGGVPIDNRPSIGQPFVGASPPRSDRFAIVVSLEAVLGGF